MMMKLFDIAAGKYGGLFAALELLLLVIANYLLVYGQQGNYTAQMAKPHLALRDHNF